MPRQLLIDDHIEFRGDALHRSNIEGPMSREMVHFHDHFLGHTLDTVQLYTATHAGAGDDISIQAAVGGQCRFKTSTTDSAACYLATALNYEDDMYAEVEARIKIADVSCTHIFFGLTDATSETTPVTPIDYDGGTKNTDGAAVAAGFVVDADYLSSSIMCCGKGATDVDSGIDWEDNEWHTLRLKLDPDAVGWFWIDSVAKAKVTDAIATSGTALCMMLCVSTRTTGGKYVYLDYWESWQNRGE